MNKFLSLFNIVNIKLFILSFNFFFIDFRTSISILRQTTKSINSVKEYSKKGHNVFCLGQLRKDKKSDTVFILGSGPSINEINSFQWDYIEDNDSWGFNFWLCHNFIPDIFFGQSHVDIEEDQRFNFEMDILMNQMLIDKKHLYNKVKFYLRGDNVNDYKFQKSQFGETILNSEFNYYFMPELIIRSKNKIRPIKLMNNIYDMGFFSGKFNYHPIPKFGNTVTELISLALIAGYKNIVLCGIDMNDGGHFYDEDFYLKKYGFLKKLKAWSNKSKTHPHADRKQLKYTSKDVIMDLNKFAKKRFESEIFVSNSTSSLYPEIKKYKFDN